MFLRFSGDLGKCFFFANNTYEVDEVTLSTSFSSASAYLADQAFLKWDPRAPKESVD